MLNSEFFIYVLIMSGTTYLIRVIPFILVNKKVTNKFILAFLEYIPYTVLTAMTFPAAMYVTGHIISGIVGLFVAIILTHKMKNMTVAAILSCVSVYICELIYMLV